MSANRPKRRASENRKPIVEDNDRDSDEGSMNGEDVENEEKSAWYSDSDSDPEFDQRGENDRNSSGKKKKRAFPKLPPSQSSSQKKKKANQPPTPSSTPKSRKVADSQSEMESFNTPNTVNSSTQKSLPMDSTRAFMKSDFKHEEDGQYIIILEEISNLKNAQENRTHAIWRVEDEDTPIQKYDVVSGSIDAKTRKYRVTNWFKKYDLHDDDSMYVLDVADGGLKKDGTKEVEVKILYPKLEALRDALFLYCKKKNASSGGIPTSIQPRGTNGYQVVSSPSGISQTMQIMPQNQKGKLTSEEVEALDLYTQMLISQVLEKQFIPHVIKTRDPVFYPSIEVIEHGRNERMRTRLLQNWRLHEYLQKMLRKYQYFNEDPIKDQLGPMKGTPQKCHNCNNPGPKYTNIYLEGYPYDQNTLLPAALDDRRPCEMITLCAKCTDVARRFHDTAHMRFKLYTECARKVGMLQYTFPDKTPVDIIQDLTKKEDGNRAWLNIIQAYVVTAWQKIDTNRP